MQVMREIRTREDVKLLVDEFYAEIRRDALLAPIFNGIIGDRWPAHLAKMYSFWQTILLEERTYQGSPFLPHASLPVEGLHFERWFGIFNAVLDRNFEGVLAGEARWRARQMAAMFEMKIKHHRENPDRIVLK